MKLYFIVFTIGLVLGIYLSAMFFPLLYYPATPATSKGTSKTLQKEVVRSEVVFAKSFDSIQKANNQLKVGLVKTKAALQIAKQNSRTLEQRVKAILIRKESAEEPIAFYDPSCDSLIGTVEYLMQSSTQKDSLYEEVQINLQAQLESKDSAISLQFDQYQNLKATFSKSIEIQGGLEKQNRLLTKAYKKQRVKSKVVTALLFIGSGVVAGYIINR